LPEIIDDPWKHQVAAFGKFMHTQRKLAKLSLRELAALTDVSNAYLSQLERGLHAPSIKVLRSLATAFNLSTETVLEHAGLLSEDEAGGPVDTEAAIKGDARLDDEQKAALLAVYRGFAAR
jgi:transcriptional regulator with XRE-family HTH domain